MGAHVSVDALKLLFHWSKKKGLGLTSGLCLQWEWVQSAFTHMSNLRQPLGFRDVEHDTLGEKQKGKLLYWGKEGIVFFSECLKNLHIPANLCQRGILLLLNIQSSPHLELRVWAPACPQCGSSAEPSVPPTLTKPPSYIAWPQHNRQPRKKNQAFKFQHGPCRVFGKHFPLSALFPSLPSSASSFPRTPLLPPCIIVH